MKSCVRFIVTCWTLHPRLAKKTLPFKTLDERHVPARRLKAWAFQGRHCDSRAMTARAHKLVDIDSLPVETDQQLDRMLATALGDGPEWTIADQADGPHISSCSSSDSSMS